MSSSSSVGKFDQDAYSEMYSFYKFVVVVVVVVVVVGRWFILSKLL